MSTATSSRNGQLRSIGALVSVAIVLGAAAPARAGELTYRPGEVRLAKAATWGKSRSLYLNGQSLVLALPLRESLSPQTLRVQDGLVKDIRLGNRANRTELEIRLGTPAMGLLSGVEVREEGGDLVLRLPTTAPVDPGAERETPAAEPRAGEPAALEAQARARPLAAAPIAAVAPSAKTKDAAVRAPKAPAELGLRTPESNLSSLAVLLVGVGAAAGVAFWLHRRKRLTGLGDPTINIVATRALSGKHRLLLVEAENELLLLGCTDREIRLLRTLNRTEFDRRQEKAFFSEGMRIDEENALATEELSAGPGYPDPRAPRSASSPLSRVNRRLRGLAGEERRAEAAPDEPETQPLDEKWAEGILRMRRGARGSNSDGSVFH
jgi:flagellar biogenesis protein FliO